MLAEKLRQKNGKTPRSNELDRNVNDVHMQPLLNEWNKFLRKPPGILNCETKYLENTTTIVQFAQFLIIMYNSIQVLQFSRIYFFFNVKNQF